MPLSGPSPFIMVGQNHAAVAHTGDTNEFTYATVTVPGSIMGLNGTLRIWHKWSYPNNANTKIVRLRINGSVVCAITGSTTLSLSALTMLQNRNSETSQVATPQASTGLNALTVALNTYSFDTRADMALTINGILANAADSLTLESYLVEVIRG